ncbi:MAG: YjgP/YjgQ family permease [Proteobacteria bacterium]|nr:YjgP/YjgQ family permease [Pseudomonadota bacterium]
MKKINWYIIKVISKPSAFSLFILVGMIWILQSIKFMDILINKNASMVDFLYISVLTLPDLLMLLIPLALFAGCYSGLKRMVLDSEMDAVYAAGISRLSLVKPLLLAAFIIVGVGYFVSLYAVPKSRMAFYDLSLELRQNADFLHVEPGIFNKVNKHVTVYVKEIESNQWLKNIIVYDNTHPESPVTWTAEEGVLRIGKDKKPRLVLLNGTRQEIKENQNAVLAFKSHQIDLFRQKSEKHIRQKRPQEMFIHELLETDHLTTDKQKNKYKAKFYQKLLWPLSPFALVLIPLYFLFAPVKRRFGNGKPSVYAIVSALGFVMLQFWFNSRIEGGVQGFVALAIVLEIIVPLVLVTLLVKENLK